MGAFPGVLAEDTTQAIAIASNLALMSQLEVPIISVIVGEGGSGGALALSVADRLYMFENAIYSVISPEACATILWKDQTRALEAAESLKITPEELIDLGIVDGVIRETLPFDYYGFKKILLNEISVLKKMDAKTLLKKRYQKYRRIGTNGIN